jgi:hypothetical protein
MPYAIVVINLRVAGLHFRTANSKLIITRTKSARSAKSVKTSRSKAVKRMRSSARAGSRNSGYHLAMLGISVVIVFELIAMASSFSSFGSLSTTGYATGLYNKPAYEVTKTYATNVASCENVMDSNNPLTAGYVNYIDNNKMGKAPDSCIDSNTLLEYSCNVYGQLVSEVVRCTSGCTKDGMYGYCA